MAHPTLRCTSAPEQTAEHVREGIRAGRWKHHLPGSRQLAAELKVSRNTVVAAVERLLADGTLATAGECKPHLIVDQGKKTGAGPRMLRTALLLPEALEKLPSDSQREALRVMAELKAAGHECVSAILASGKVAGKTGRLTRLVDDVDADAWLVFDGTLETLEWFVASGRPALALGGVVKNLPIAVAANYDLTPIFRETVRRLIGLGHRRIVFICRHEHRLPKPGALIRAFHEELQVVGVKPGEYNTPDWEETPDGLDTLLKSLFRFTPPTAIICENLHTTVGALGFLTKSGLSIPGDVSVVSLWPADNLSGWAFPHVRIAHVESDDSPFYRRVREWASNVARGRADIRWGICPARLVEGDTMGPAKKA